MDAESIEEVLGMDEQEEATEQGSEQGNDPPEKQWTEADEADARALGWKAPDEWRGKVPAGYIDDPRQFRERAMSFGPVRKLIEDNEKLRRDTDLSLRRMEALTDAAIKSAKARAREEIARLTAEQRKAAETGDVETFDALERRKSQTVRDAMDAEASYRPADPGPQPNAADAAAIEVWAAGKSWLKRDKIKTAAAVAAYDEAMAEGFTTPQARLAYVDRIIAERFPEAPPPRQQASVEGGMPMGAGVRASAFSKLPKDAREAFASQVKRGWFEDTPADRQTYAELYENPNG